MDQEQNLEELHYKLEGYLTNFHLLCSACKVGLD
jgi:hypothetical protein